MSEFLKQAALVFLGAGTGGVARFAIGEAARGLFPAAAERFPWPTLLINVTGCAAIGLLAPMLKGDAKLVLIVGVLGGYTTFSAFGREVVDLWARGATVGAAAYVALSVTLGIGASAAGAWIAGANAASPA
ncbi:MAG: fluoride efflux transporter FluC [Phycisphaerales bacterium]